jgi:hypothetical protein
MTRFWRPARPKVRCAQRQKAIVDCETQFNRIEADLLVLKWMTGAVAAEVISLVIEAFLA